MHFLPPSRNIVSLMTAVLLLCLLTAGCGKKGPLYLPEPPEKSAGGGR